MIRYLPIKNFVKIFWEERITRWDNFATSAIAVSELCSLRNRSRSNHDLRLCARPSRSEHLKENLRFAISPLSATQSDSLENKFQPVGKGSRLQGNLIRQLHSGPGLLGISDQPQGPHDQPQGSHDKHQGSHDQPQGSHGASVQGVQGGADAVFAAWVDSCWCYGVNSCDQLFEGLQHQPLDPSDLDLGRPGTQGVQGDDCVHFDLWSHNCHRPQLHRRSQTLHNFHSGRLTLTQLFAQQDAVIHQIANQYRQKRPFSSQLPGNTPESGGPEGGGQISPTGQREKLKRAVKDYGATVIVFHVAISLASLGGFYAAVSSGLDLVGVLRWLDIGESVLESRLAVGTGTFVVAYAVHKVFAPLRIAITLTCTPLIVRHLRSRGVLKPPKSAS